MENRVVETDIRPGSGAVVMWLGGPVAVVADVRGPALMW